MLSNAEPIDTNVPHDIDACFRLRLLDNRQRIDAALLQPPAGLSASQSQSDARLHQPTLPDHEPSAGSTDSALAIASQQQQQPLPEQRPTPAPAQQADPEAGGAQRHQQPTAYADDAQKRQPQRNYGGGRSTNAGAQRDQLHWRRVVSRHQRRR